jgi:hypothetical protein
MSSAVEERSPTLIGTTMSDIPVGGAFTTQEPAAVRGDVGPRFGARGDLPSRTHLDSPRCSERPPCVLRSGSFGGRSRADACARGSRARDVAPAARRRVAARLRTAAGRYRPSGPAVPVGGHRPGHRRARRQEKTTTVAELDGGFSLVPVEEGGLPTPPMDLVVRPTPRSLQFTAPTDEAPLG